MATFISWQAEYERAKNALASRTWDEYFMSSIENHEQMRTTYVTLNNITKFLEWLGFKAAEEASGNTEGGLLFVIGGC